MKISNHKPDRPPALAGAALVGAPLEGVRNWMVRVGCWLALSSLACPTQGEDRPRLYSQGPIAFSEFRATPPADIPLDAVTMSHLKYDYRYRTFTRNNISTVTLTKITFTAQFISDESWTKRPRDVALLRHEQGHFDVTEILQRKATAEWRSRINKFSVQNSSLAEGKKEFDRRIQQEMEPYLERLRRLQKQYDAETNHGRNGERQRQWEQLLAQLLKNPAGAFPLAPAPAAAPGLRPSR